MATKGRKGLTPLECRWYVYALVDPRDGKIFYIGKGCGSRKDQHAKEARRRTSRPSRKILFILAVQAAGFEVEARIIRDGLTEAVALEIERVEIAARRPSLTNVAVGGSPTSQEAKKVALVRWAKSVLDNPRYAESRHVLLRLISDPLKYGWTEAIVHQGQPVELRF